MLTIHKYLCPISGPTSRKIAMPTGAKILTAQFQPDNGLVLWAEVETNNRRTIRCFDVVGTGMELETPSESRKYIATVQEPDGYVWHVFELI